MKKKLLLPLAALLALGVFPISPLSGPTERLSLIEAANIDTGAPVDVSVIVDGRTITVDAPPRLVNGSLTVPLRNIAEALGAEVVYDESTRSVTAVKDEMKVTVFLDDTNAFMNGAAFTLAVPPVRNGDVTMVPLRFFGEAFGSVVKWDGLNGKVTIDREDNLLPAVSSLDKLKELMEASQQTQVYTRELMRAVPAASAADGVTLTAAESSTVKEKASVSTDYSATNVQVQGIDEADVVKTDGEYIYQVNKERIIIARAYPADEMQVISTLPLADYKLTPTEIYIDDGLLVVIGHERLQGQPSSYPANGSKARIVMPIRQENLKAVVFDTSSKSNIKQVKEIALDGRYVTSRKVGSQVYVITNKWINGYAIENGTADESAPSYRDSAAGAEAIRIPYEKIRYFPDTVYSSYLLIAGFDVKKPEQNASVSAYLGAGENVYASANNLYVTVTQRSTDMQPLMKRQSAADSASILPVTPSKEESSVVYKFLMDQGKVRFAASGEVPGHVLNQFSMDESNGYFRIATTKGDMWRTDEHTSKNNIYVLNESLNITGKIEDIAPGESIYSVRFMNNRAYMVTFRKVDPLFVLDLSNPQKPAILGKLKIPGYSDYLHPYDETHLIGFGKDAVEVANEWGSGNSGNSGTTAFYQGLKIAMFDVSDVSNPKELFKESIGDRGTDSPLLSNHKALLFSREKNLLAFPVTVAKVGDDTPNKDKAWAYGSFAFQGAYVYHLDLTSGFQLKGTISHLTDDDLKAAGNSWYQSDRSIDRALYIGNTLYTLSQSEIRANELSGLKEIKRLPIASQE